MPNQIDVSTIDFNIGGTGYNANFKLDDPTTWPNGPCTLPTLLPLDLPTLDNNFTTLNSDCKFNFSAAAPIPPVFIPKPEINLPCPTGYTFSSDVSFTATGCTTFGGSLDIVTDPDAPCGYRIQGGIVLDVPCPPCPSGMTFSGSPSLTIQGNGVTTLGPTGEIGPIQFKLTGGPCNYTIVGGGTIVLPPPPPPPPQVGNDVAADCLDCTASCCSVRIEIQDTYLALGGGVTPQTPQKGDIINVCVAVYEVVGNPDPVSTCTGDCENIATAQVIDFTVSSTVYYARRISTTCVVSDYFPFEIFANKHFVLGVWDNTYDITLYPGVVNHLLPTNIFDTINATITSTQYVVLTVNSDGYAVTSSTWSLMSSQPTPPEATGDAPPSVFYVTLGVIFYNSGPNTISIFQIINDNITATPTIWTTVSRVGAGPYELAYVNYYTWVTT